MPKIPQNFSVLCECGERAVLQTGRDGNFYCKHCNEFMFSYFYSKEKDKYVFSKEKLANLKNFYI